MSDTPLPRLSERDRPWLMRTYAGHSDAKRSNELYRRNLEKGQTGLSVAFDLPTQTGYDPDHELANGEVGKVGVSIAHVGDMRTLLDGIPLALKRCHRAKAWHDDCSLRRRSGKCQHSPRPYPVHRGERNGIDEQHCGSQGEPGT